MTPLITIQILGVIFRIKTGAEVKIQPETVVEDIIEMEGDA